MNFAQRIQLEKQELMHATERVTRQMDIDTLQIALSRYGKISFGYQRIMEITELWEQVRAEYIAAITPGPEQDVAQHHLDTELLQIARDDAKIIPFHLRYPELNRPDYRGRREKHGH